jgi:hypothetical protein
MRRKWGSCSSSGTITLANDLTQQDRRFQDYVIVHELLHLRLSTHGPMFKAMMSVYVPGWQAMKDRRLQEPSSSAHGAISTKTGTLCDELHTREFSMAVCAQLQGARQQEGMNRGVRLTARLGRNVRFREQLMAPCSSKKSRK